MNALEITNLTKQYKDFKLDHLNLTLPAGTIMGLVGENGAGKSTTIKLILDMIRRDAGTIKILGRDNRDNLRELKEDIGVVLDEVGLSDCLTAAEAGKIMRYTYKNWRDDTYAALLKRFSVPEKQRFKELSRGTKMKLGIAAALSHEPKLLLFDEATSGLDPVVRDEVMEIVSEFTRDESHAVLMSSHIVSDLEKTCDYIAFLHEGNLLLCEEKDALKERYVVVHGTRDELDRLPREAVLGSRVSPYGAEAIVLRDAAPAGALVSPVDIEQLFLFMVKGER